MTDDPRPIHPTWLRATHWLNALAVVIMSMSGWRIYNASPLFDFKFGKAITLGGWLGGANTPAQARLSLPQADFCKGAPAMSHKHENLIESIFRDPISGNIHWREVESLLLHLGAEVESLSGARLRVKLNGHEDVLHRPHHGNTLDRSAVKILREYLARARVTPSLLEAAKPRAPG